MGDALLEQRVAGVFVAVVGLCVDQAALKQWVLRDWLLKEVLAAAAEIADRLSRRRRAGRSASAAGTAPCEAAGGRLMQFGIAMIERDRA